MANMQFDPGCMHGASQSINDESTMDAFLRLIDGCSESRNDKDKVLLLTDAAITFNNLSDADFRSCYDKLHQFHTSVWPDVLTNLSQRIEWKSIAYLILGPNLDALRFGEIKIAENIDKFCTGVAGKSSSAAVETRTVFKYLEQHDEEGIADWLEAVLFAVYTNGGDQTLRNMTVDDRDCPLHAVTRFVLQTGRSSLLGVFPDQDTSWCDVSSRGESVFHLLAKYSPPIPADFLVRVTRSILEKGYRSIMVGDVDNKIPFDLLDTTYPMSVFNEFLPNETRERKMGKLNDRGVLKMQHGDFNEAILLFSKVIDFYRHEAESKSGVYQEILQNRAKCYLQTEEYQLALNDANKSIKTCIGNQDRLKANRLAGRALVGLEQYGQACLEFLYAFDCDKTSTQSMRADILSDLANLFPLRESIHGYLINGEHRHVWAQVCYLLVRGNKWTSANEAYELFEISDWSSVPLQLDLKPFCSIKDIRSNPWVVDLMRYLLHCGSDKRTITLEEGDTYLHASVKISLVAKCPALLSYLIQNMGDSDQHTLDSHGNTLLHIATKEKKVEKDIRLNVIEILHGCGVDPLVPNCENKSAITYLSDEKTKKLIRSFMPKQEKQKTHANQKQSRSYINKSKTSSQNKKAKQNKGKTHECERCEHIYSNAVEKLKEDITDGLKLLVDVLNMDHRNQQHAFIEQKAMVEFSNYMGKLSSEDLSVCLDSLRKQKYFRIIDILVCDKKWLLLEMILRKCKKCFSEGELKECASEFTVESLVSDTSFTSEEEKLRLALNLLENGWRIADDNGQAVLKNAVKLTEFKVAIELVNRGADISKISLYVGDTPIHAAVLIALQEKQLTFIQTLLDKQKEDRVKYAYLDPEQVDANGDCIYHILAKADYSDFALQLTKTLCCKISAKYYNKELKYPKDYVKDKNSPLLKYLDEAFGINPSHEQVEYDKRKNKVPLEESKVAQENESKHPPKLSTEEILKRIETYISLLPKQIKATCVDSQTPGIGKHNASLNKEEPVLSAIEAINHETKGGKENKRKNLLKELRFKGDLEQHCFEREKNTTANDTSQDREETHERTGGATLKTLEDIAGKYSFAPKVEENIVCIAESESSANEKIDMFKLPPLESCEDTQQTMGLPVPAPVNTQVNIKKNAQKEFDENMFENLTWEVECTDKVRKTLKDKKVVFTLRCKMIKIIQSLANGDWQNSYCRKIKNVPPTLTLFKANLSKGSRIIWEKAISFSSRCSDTADRRLNPSAEDATEQVYGGRIYTEVIRIWDIVMDHDKSDRSIEKIKDSHQRGETCVIQRKLKCVKKENDQRRTVNDKTHPLLFTETQDDSVQVQHFPPASPNKTEYNIVKFYTWDRALERHILQNGSINVEFPFKTTEKEDAIIRLSGKGPILLLGRSGTGKTMCCLYRLWNQYNNARRFLNSDEEEKDEACNNQREQSNAIEDQSDKTDDRGEDLCKCFHQLFVTKNHILAAEVKKTFCGFKNQNESISGSQTDRYNQVLPDRLQDLQEHAFPLFLTLRQLLCKLDASIGEPFFSRKNDGSLKYHVDGWADTDKELANINILNYDSAVEDNDDIVDDYEDENTIVNQEANVEPHAKKEVTYEVFENDVWPKLERKTKGVYHPSLIWTEIMSFIKGSYKSLSKGVGFLSKEEYEKIDKKTAPAFSEKRPDIYSIFKSYEDMKTKRHMFDETDVVHSVFQRLAQLETSPVAIHEIYVDETQDFTQAELFLLIRLCQNPNNMFLTGDSAQSIMRGISFRFENLKSLFQYVNEEMKRTSTKKKGSMPLTIDVPKKVHKLIYNYRSHSGIVSLASSIIDILGHFFKESFDVMDPDQGLLPGPKPVLLESCSLGDLAVLLRGNKRKTPTIEFGAHQVILVYNEEARESLPEELRFGLVLTIFESKGLEFDDVLLFNFFKDSQASNEWRVVTKLLKKLASDAGNKTLHQNEICVTLDQDILVSKNRPRPLDFDENLHKLLNNELKQLYTALTRARVNVWIFDEDAEKRSPMFEYFKARKLVKSVKRLDEENLSSMIFVEQSSSQDWIQMGEYFTKNRLYLSAAKCFRIGGDCKKEMLAQANDRALVATRRRHKPKEFKEMRADFLFAAEMYLKCEYHLQAAKCLGNAKEVELAIKLYEKLGQYDIAAELCKKKGQFVECSNFYERSGKFSQAVSILYNDKQYGLALDVVDRYKKKEMDMMKSGKQSDEELRANRPDAIYTEEKICQRAAEEFHQHGNIKRMHEAVSRFKYEVDKIEFYKRKQYNIISDAANVLANTGRKPEAVDLYLKHGKLIDARLMAEKSEDEMLIAKCLLSISRITIADMPIDYDEEKKDLEKALSIFKKRGDKNLSGQVMLLLAKVYDDARYIISAGKEFSALRQCTNKAGYVECCNFFQYFMKRYIQVPVKFLLKGADYLFDICNKLLLTTSSSNIEPYVRNEIREYLEFYGIVQQRNGSLVTFPRTKPLYDQISPAVKDVVQVSFETTSKRETCICQIVEYLLKESKPWLILIKNTLLKQRVSLQRCKWFQLGQECTNEDCKMMHKAHTTFDFNRLIDTDLLLAEYETYINAANDIVRKYISSNNPAIPNVLKLIKSANLSFSENDQYVSCYLILKDLLPETGHPLILAEASRQFLKRFRTNELVLKHIKRYLLQIWHDSTSCGRKMENKAVYGTEIHILFEFSYHLFHYNSGKVRFQKTPKQEMLNFECALNSEVSKDPVENAFENLEQKYTIMLTQTESENKISSIACVAHWFTDAYENLTSGDPLQAVLSFGKICTDLSQRKLQGSYYPDIAHFLLWLEFYTALAFFLIASVKSQVDGAFTILLPNNYIAVMSFIESTFPKGSMPIDKAISSWSADRKQNLHAKDLFDEMKDFVFAISGQAQKENIRNIILQKCKKTNDNYVLLERFLILHLTMMCNIGKSIPVECEKYLVNSAQKMLSMSDIPKRLTTILEKGKQFKGIKHVADSLDTFLTDRRLGEHILAIEGTQRQIKRYSEFPEDASLQPSTFLKDYFAEPEVEIQDSHETVTQEQYSTYTDTPFHNDDFPDIIHRKEKMEISATSVCFVTPNDIFLETILKDIYECNICGVNFESSLLCKEENENSAAIRGNRTELTERNSQRQDSLIDNDTYKDMLVKAKKEHENDLLHCENMEVFKLFRNIYETQLKPLITRVRVFLENKNYNLSDEKYILKHFEKYKEEIQRMKLNYDRIETEIRETCRERKWSANKKCLDQIASELQSDLNLIQPYVEQISLKDDNKRGSLSGAIQTKELAGHGEENDAEENAFERVVLEPFKRTKKYITKK